jgi:hypothetical protein
MKLHIPLSLTIALACGLLLAGCASALPMPANSGSPAPVASAASSAPPAASSGKHVDVCKALPLATLEKVTGKTYTTIKDAGYVKPKATVDKLAEGLAASACNYNGPTDSLQNFAVKVFYDKTAATLSYLAETDSTIYGEDLTANVSGIGDKALTDGSDDLAVRYGNNVVYIQDLSEPPGSDLVPLSQMEQLAAIVHSAMK